MAARGDKKRSMQLAMEEEELRSLRIPSTAHRGNLSPSKNSFLPTLQEQVDKRGLAAAAAAAKSSTSPAVEAAMEEEKQRGQRQVVPPEQVILSNISSDLLESVKQDFLACQGSLDMEQFTRAMLRSLEAGNEPEGLKRGTSFASGAGADSGALELAQAAQAPRDGISQAATVVDLFHSVDVHGEGSITWDEVSNHLIEQGMAGSDDQNVDAIKTYEPSPVVDLSKHEHPVEKLVYLEQIDAVACLSHNSRDFRLYDPNRCTVRNTVSGHRGTVVNCCFVDGYNQVATTGADMTICLWDATSLGLRNRLSAKDVQLCIQWDPSSECLFSGSIDGTLSRWDLQGMCLVDTRRGQHKKAINDLLMVRDVNLLASASSDGGVLMWDTATMRPKKTFKGHKKGTFSLAYSTDYQCLLTAGLDQDALVWNPYVERVPIFRLKGHTQALCGVEVVPGTPQILTADVAGTFKLWDIRNFRCVQSFGGNENSMHDLNTFCVLPQHRQLAAGGSKVSMYDYTDEQGGELVTDTAGVTDALYNPRVGEFYTVSKQSLKSWGADTGSLFKVLRDVAKHEITAACLSESGQKIYLGDSAGRVAAHALHNGAKLTEFFGHQADISCLALWKGTNKLFSSSWDGVVKVATDEGSRKPQLKAEFQHHSDSVTCMVCSPELMLLATGGTDMHVNLYDLKTLKLEHSLSKIGQHVVTGVDFLSQRCLLAVADHGGHVTLWRARPHGEMWQRVGIVKNSSSMDPICGLSFAPALASPVTSLEAPVLAKSLYEGFQGYPERLNEVLLPLEEEWAFPPGVFSLLRQACLQRVQTRDPTLDEDAVFEAKIPEGDFLEAFGRWLQDVSEPRLYTADAKGWLRCWDLAALCERQQIENCDLPHLFELQHQAQLRGLKRSTKEEPARPAIRAPTLGHREMPRLQTHFADDGGGGAFLTGLDLENEPSRGGSVTPKATSTTTVRAAVSAAGEVGAARSGLTSAERPEVRAIYEVEAHSDAILGMYVTSQPPAVITCGHDRRVRAWSLGLERQGVLLQSTDPSFSFPYDPAEAQRRKFRAAAVILERIGPLPLSPGPKLPALPPNGTRQNSQEAVLALKGDRKRGSFGGKKDPDKAWKATAEQIVADPNAGEEDYMDLFEQMERYGRELEDGPVQGALDRMQHHTERRHAAKMQHRSTGLSLDEAAAADRLAKAMAALGGDTFGTYKAMAKSIRPPRKGGDQEAGGYPAGGDAR